MHGSALELELLAVASEAARAAARELEPRFGQGGNHVQAKSTPTDLVSEADLQAESAIREVLGQRRPQDAILGEEGGQTLGEGGGPTFGKGGGQTLGDGASETGNGELRWVIDPLDGTINFLFGVPQFAVSVACEDPRGMLVGVVLDPLRGECFAASRSGAPELNGEQIKGSGRTDLSTSLVSTGFGYDAAVRERQAAVLARVLPRVRDIRRAGAAALDLAWCACGRYDAYYERGVKPWDHAAGGLIAARAGLLVRVLAATEQEPEGLLAAAPAVADELAGLVLGTS